MLSDVLRYPVGDADARDAFAVCVGFVLAALVSLRVGAALWPDLLALASAALTVLPAALFAGYLGRVLLADPGQSGAPAFAWSLQAVRVGIQVLVVAGVYFLPAAFALVATAYVLVSGRGGPVLTIAATGALLVTVAAVYVLPGALATAAGRGVRAGLSRSAVGGLASGAYFYAWTVATSFVVLGWTLLAISRAATIAAVAAAVGFTYSHVVAARLLSDGLAKSAWASKRVASA